MPLVSIIVPVFNAASTIEETVQSVRIQSLSNFELISVDDGSVDTSPILLDNMAKSDVRVKVIHQKNSGPGVSRNVGIAAARGKYILFLDSDDLLASGMVLERALAKAEATNCDCLLAGARGLTADGKSGEMLKWCLRTDLAPSTDVFEGKSVGLRLFFLAGTVPWSKLFRRDFIMHHKLRFPHLKRSEDFPFVQLALALSQRTTILDEPLVLHRTGVSESLESTKDETPCMFVDAERIFFAELRNRGLEGEFGNAARARAMLRFDYNLHAMRSFDGLNVVFERIREERAKLAMPKDCEAFTDFVAAEAKVDKILSYGSAGEWLRQRLIQTEAQLRVSQRKLRDCRARLAVLSRRVATAEGDVSRQKKCFAYRIGMFVTWPARKAWGGVKCLRENGVKYTVKHAAGKALRLLGSKVRW